MLVAGLVFLVDLIINIVRRIADVPDDVGAVLIAARDLAPAAIPVALLIGFYRQSERRLRALVDAIPDRMVRFTRDGGYVESTADEADGIPTTGRGRPRRPAPPRARCSRDAGARPLAARPTARSTPASSRPTTSPWTCPSGSARASRRGSRRAGPTR